MAVWEEPFLLESSSEHLASCVEFLSKLDVDARFKCLAQTLLVDIRFVLASLVSAMFTVDVFACSCAVRT